jgi:GT2 family glycosyltransferase
MKTSLIICTYMRPQPLKRLLDSVYTQTHLPDEVLIVDGSTNNETEALFQNSNYNNLKYFKVAPQDRGLTRQRNFGIKKVSNDCEIVCFLDDDTALKPDYFEQLISTYQSHPDALGVGGLIVNEVRWEQVGENYRPKPDEYYFDGFKRKDGSRFVLRKKLGLDSNVPPAHYPEFGHGRSVGFLPPSGKVYPAMQLMGGVSSFRKSVFQTHRFSTYFEGYGLYEDADFCLRLSKTGPLYVNTAAQLQHLHEPDGRPNQYNYGKMVVRNGWYVWRVAYPNPSLKAKLKWHAITILLTLIRFTNIFTTKQHKAAFTETLGRKVGWWSLFFDEPR